MGAVDETLALHSTADDKSREVQDNLAGQMSAIDELIESINAHQGFNRSSHLDDAIAEATAAKTKVEEAIPLLAQCVAHVQSAAESMMY